MEKSTIQQPPQAGSPSGRNLGIDLLRCAAMWMIVCLHVINQGGAGGAAANNETASNLLFPLKVVVTCGVNIYALISGYVTVYGRFRPARIAELWLQVFFWNMVIACFGELLRPRIMNDFWIRYIFPLTQKCFWYFTAYVGVYAFSPLINRGVKALDPKQCRALSCSMLLLFSLGSALGYAGQGDPWRIGSGYSVLWLLALYVVGACVRHGRLLQQVCRWKLLLTAALCVALVCLWRQFILLQDESVSFWKEQQNQLLSYISPALTVFSLCLLALFSRLRVSGFAAGLAGFFAPLTFGVYIIHVHHVNWVWMELRFQALGKLAPPLIIAAVLGVSLALFLVCAVLDWLRSRLFRLCRIQVLLDHLEGRIFAKLK